VKQEQTKKTKGFEAPKGIKQTPMMRQFFETKESYPDCILFFRLGDFYEMFFEDAEIASKILDIALTSRSKGKEGYPMCGVPHFSANGYIAKLVEQGHKVAICDQVEDAKQAKGIVKRQVTRVVSPGMITDLEDLNAKESNYLGGVIEGNDKIGFAFLDISTADFRVTEVDSFAGLIDELARIRVRELLLPKEAQNSAIHNECRRALQGQVIRFVDYEDDDQLPIELFDHVSQMEDGLAAARMVYGYTAASLPGSLEHIRRLVSYEVNNHMIIDENSWANLELSRTRMEGRRKGSLLYLLDSSCTPMGARMLGDWLMYPLLEPEKINARLDAVEQLVKDAVLCADLREELANIRDLERLATKISIGRGTPKDLGILRDSLLGIPKFKTIVCRLPQKLTVDTAAEEPLSALANIVAIEDTLDDLFDNLDRALVESPPIDVVDGEAIKPGFNKELDHYVELATSGRTFIAQLEEQERNNTKISSLKIKYNKVFGYFIEVTKANLHLVPDHYRRKQTTANAERYETDQLKEQEVAILKAQDDRIDLERKLINDLVELVRKNVSRLLDVAKKIACADVLASFAQKAAKENYSRPEVNQGEVIKIEDGRHPVVESMLEGDRFVPNDVRLDCQKEQLLIITGPNMAGKSTAIRQVALITILAQMGSFVPATSAKIGVVDRVFTRIGAGDDLARGQSTFMIEMIETANILKNATRKSLLILDEIGRGTSTFDGLSIAWAVAEYIHDQIGARTLFATHYHQLTDLALTKNRTINYNVTVKEWKDQIVFLRRLVKGVCSRSYGIQVGVLAGLPGDVTKRARKILENLEGQGLDEVGKPKLSVSNNEEQKASGQLHLFGGPHKSKVEEEIEQLDLDTMTPLEALQFLHRLKGEET
jgi:DNA mismatch repair protein MutS